MTRTTLIVLLATAVLAVIVALQLGSRPHPRSSMSSKLATPAPSPAQVAPGAAPRTNFAPAPDAAPAEQTIATPQTNSRALQTPEPPVPVDPLPPGLAALPPATVLENMRSAIRNYGSTFAGNPVGTNPEITRALAGGNSKQINFLKADGNRVNTKGELVDQWGTPYFFHQLSGTETEIRSAGPDRILWTADDLTTR